MYAYINTVYMPHIYVYIYVHNHAIYGLYAVYICRIYMYIHVYICRIYIIYMYTNAIYGLYAIYIYIYIYIYSNAICGPGQPWQCYMPSHDVPIYLQAVQMHNT
jgi:hypothetical protein